MFRQGLRRCAAASRSGQLVISLRTVRQFLTNASTQQVNHYVSPLKAVEFAARNYSTEADAQQQVDGAVPATGEITSFAALAENGVHPNLLRAIVKDMGYDTMTPVQAKTINPALKGTDMYVFLQCQPFLLSIESNYSQVWPRPKPVLAKRWRSFSPFYSA